MSSELKTAVERALERAADLERRGLTGSDSLTPETQPEQAADDDSDKPNDYWCIDGRLYPKRAEYCGHEINTECSDGGLGDHRFTATIDDVWRVKDMYGHPEGSKQAAEYAIRRLEEAAIARERLREHIGDHADALFEEAISCWLERI